MRKCIIALLLTYICRTSPHVCMCEMRRGPCKRLDMLPHYQPLFHTPRFPDVGKKVEKRKERKRFSFFV